MKILCHLIVFLVCLLVPLVASASDGVLTLVSEQVEGTDAAYWWADTTPRWTATDGAVRKALEREGVGFSAPDGKVNLSRIYRKHNPTDANALAMASVFGHDRVLVGSVTLTPTDLRPAGIVGWRARVDVRLIEARQGSPTVLSRAAFTRSTWGGSEEEALAELRATLADVVARTVAGATMTKSGPVGFASGELVLGFRGVGTTARLDAIRRALLGFSGIQSVSVAWASQGFIALEVNPGTPDSAQSLNQYASLLARQTFDDFALTVVDATMPDVVEFEVAGGRR